MPRQTVYSEAELFEDHAYDVPHVINNARLHGGFVNEIYVPPRSAVRYPAIQAWTAVLEAQGGSLFAADASLLTGPRVPSVGQQQILIRRGMSQSFWNGLTVTGKIEGRGRVLAEMAFPDLQSVIEDDISQMGIGHLNKGLLRAHGLDEGGEPDKGIGGHDVMWFVARDLVFGADAFPDVEPPERIARPEAGQRLMPEIGPEFDAMLSFLMNLLIIEFRAEIGFANTQEIMRTEDLFPTKRAEAELAAVIIERIRTDEAIHVESLRLYLGELRTVTFKTLDGGRIAGSVLIDRFWSGLVTWATVDQPRIAAIAQHEALKALILAHEEGEEMLREFEALSELDVTEIAAVAG